MSLRLTNTTCIKNSYYPAKTKASDKVCVLNSGDFCHTNLRKTSRSFMQKEIAGTWSHCTLSEHL